MPAPGIAAMHCCWHWLPVRPLKVSWLVAPLVQYFTAAEKVHENGGGDEGGGEGGGGEGGERGG